MTKRIPEHRLGREVAGAEIPREPTDEFYGDRVYGAADPEGQRWFFAKHVRDVPAEEMMEAAAQMAQSS